jgi:dephospho-CoA kinase
MNTIQPKIIAICGYKGSGKDTIANYLSNKYNYKHYKISSKVKDIVKILFNVNDYDYDNNKEFVNEKWGISIRQMMQFVGTDMFQFKIQELLPNINRDFWIKTLFSDELIKNINNTNIVLSDLRFIHEFNYLKKLNIPIIIIRVDNSNIKKNDEHISEREYINIPYDYYINNNNDIHSLYNKIDECIINYQNKQL